MTSDGFVDACRFTVITENMLQQKALRLWKLDEPAEQAAEYSPGRKPGERVPKNF